MNVLHYFKEIVSEDSVLQDRYRLFQLVVLTMWLKPNLQSLTECTANAAKTAYADYSLCSHTIAVAELESNTENFFNWYKVNNKQIAQRRQLNFQNVNEAEALYSKFLMDI